LNHPTGLEQKVQNKNTTNTKIKNLGKSRAEGSSRIKKYSIYVLLIIHTEVGTHITENVIGKIQQFAK
jgi:hypothetical protein